MPELTGAPDLDARLAEIDRRLREIQIDLAPGREPQTLGPPRPGGRSGPLAELLQRDPPAVPAPASPASEHEIAALGGLHERLAASMRELLEGYEAVLERLAAMSPTRARSRTDEVIVNAGPFASTEALRAFERALAELPGVRDVDLRGFEGSDRAIIDVRLEDPTS